MPKVRPLDDQLCFSLYAASMAISRVYKPLLDELGITYPQYLVLHALWERDGRTVGEIARRLSLESSTVTPLVKRLEKAGFATRTRNPDDERQVQVRLTETGNAMREQSACLGALLLDRSAMTEADVSGLNRAVQGLWDALKADDPPVTRPSS